MLLNTASPCWRALRLARALPAPVRGPRLLRPFFRFAATFFADVIAHHRRGRRALVPWLLELGIDNFVRHPAQALTQTLALEIELREHVVAPGDRNTE